MLQKQTLIVCYRAFQPVRLYALVHIDWLCNFAQLSHNKSRFFKVASMKKTAIKKSMAEC